MLSDPDKRRQYDQFGHAAFDGGAGAGAGGFGGFSGFDFGGEDIFGDLFGGMFGGGGSRATRTGPMKGANVRASVRLTFEEGVFGCKKEIKVKLQGRMCYMSRFGSKAGYIAYNMSEV